MKIARRNKTLIFLFGDLPRTSFLTQQLRITSVFDLFADDQWYGSSPASWFPLADIEDIQTEVEFRRASGVLSEDRIVEFCAHVAEFQRVILWPMAMRPLDRGQWSKCLTFALNTKNCSLNLGTSRAFILTEPRWTQTHNHFSAQLDCEDFAAAPGPFNPLRVSPRVRSFNQMHSHGEIITKISQNPAKSEAEIFFLRNVPTVLQNYFPPVLSSDHGPGISSYQIPRFNMMDLSRHMIHRSLSERNWEVVFSKIHDYMTLCPRRNVSPQISKGTLHTLFIEKLENRLSSMPVLLNDSELRDTVRKLSTAIMSSTRNLENELVFSHGDLCFSNILFDLQTYDMKLVDPRGSSAVANTFLPPLYDFAKLSQCIFGGYDLILAQDLVMPKLAPDFILIKRMFRKLMRDWNIDERSVRLAEASLFFSMIPMHLDQPQLHGAMLRAGKRAMFEAEAHSRAS